METARILTRDNGENTVNRTEYEPNFRGKPHADLSRCSLYNTIEHVPGELLESRGKVLGKS